MSQLCSSFSRIALNLIPLGVKRWLSGVQDCIVHYGAYVSLSTIIGWLLDYFVRYSIYDL